MIPFSQCGKSEYISCSLSTGDIMVKRIKHGKNKGKYKVNLYVLSGHRGLKKYIFRLFGKFIMRRRWLFNIIARETNYVDKDFAVTAEYGISNILCEKCGKKTYYDMDGYNWEDQLHCTYCSSPLLDEE